jgi:ATP-dependent helicase/DNAse subunit B
MPDKFLATWVSHSSISDFLRCPRAYYLKNVYKDPKTKHKIQLVSPPLALGSAVHEVLESLSGLPTAERLNISLIERFNQAWKKVSGKKGGFSSKKQEAQYRDRGEEMLRRVMNKPGPVTRLAVKIKQELPNYWLSIEDEIILCGKIDWLEYFPETDSVHIIDFKTSKKEENDASLQLPIYRLLVENCQHRQVQGASYWYLELSDTLSERILPDLTQAHNQVLEIAKKVKLARALNHFKCPQGSQGCLYCRPLEKIIKGEAEYVGINDFNQDLYMLAQEFSESNQMPTSEVL